MKAKGFYHFGVQCAKCLKRMFSFSVHDYKTCGCSEGTMVDGGRQYLRYGWSTVAPKRIRHTERLDGKYPKLVRQKDAWPY